MSVTSVSEFPGNGPPVGRRRTGDDGANLLKCTISRDVSQENDSAKQKLHCLRLYQGRQDRTYGKHVAILPAEQHRAKNTQILDAKSRNANGNRGEAPVKKKPIKFKDAVNRKFSFPFELCCTWQGMEDLIKQAFLHIEVIGPHVNDGHYDLVGPNGDIILPQAWESVIEPDWTITMQMWPIPERQKAPDPPTEDDPGHYSDFNEESIKDSSVLSNDYGEVDVRDLLSNKVVQQELRTLKKPGLPVVKEMPSLNSPMNRRSRPRRTEEEPENLTKKRPRTSSPERLEPSRAFNDWMMGRSLKEPPRKGKRLKTDSEILREMTQAAKALLKRGGIAGEKPRRPPIFPK